MVQNQEFILFTGNANPQLAQAIGILLEKEIYCPVSYFADGEIRIHRLPNIRRSQVVIVQSTTPPIHDRLMELVLMIDAARRASASEITAVIPYFGYGNSSISASIVANMIAQSGADRILTIDLHEKQIEGFIHCPWDNLNGSYPLVSEIKRALPKNLVVVSPSREGIIRASEYAQFLNMEVAVLYDDQTIIGNVSGKDVLIIDDIIDSGETIFNASVNLKKKGAKNIYAALTHGLFTSKSLKQLALSPIKKIIVTDTIMQIDAVLKNPKITVVSVAELLAETVRRLHAGESISIYQ